MVNAKSLVDKFAENGFQAKVTAINHLADLRQEMAELNKAGILDDYFMENSGYMADFEYDYSAVLPGASSLFIVAVPSSATSLNFTWDGRPQTVIIPPTYLFSDSDNAVFRIAGEELAKGHYSWHRAKVPEKLLAARTGLSRYGRNNISYISGFGSYYSLVPFVSDMPVDNDVWREKERLPECDNCRACVNACPTQCIDMDRNVIHGEKCLTRFNESPEPFPGWLNESWHNALLGCMRCQLACPQNKAFNRIVPAEEQFTTQEVQQLLDAADFDQLPATTYRKLERLNLTDYDLPLAALQRNMKAVMK